MCDDGEQEADDAATDMPWWHSGLPEPDRNGALDPDSKDYETKGDG